MNQRIIDYCAEEVRRQGRGPLEVAYMIRAWQNAQMTRGGEPHDMTVEDIMYWGHLIEPTLNPPDKFRYMTVYVGDHVAPGPQEVMPLMKQFVSFVNEREEDTLTPEEAYFEFEYIHPFRDGNGRTGKIILNLLNGTMRNPVWPTNKWGIKNP